MVQAPFEIVQVIKFVPTANPVAIVELAVVSEIDPNPDNKFQTPVPTRGLFASKEIVSVTSQMFWSGPAIAKSGKLLTSINTVSTVGVQTPLEIVHTNKLVPLARPPTAVFSTFGFKKVAAPLITDHIPEPVSAEFAVKFKEAVVSQIVWSPPAFATVGNGEILIFTVSAVFAQTPFETVHIKKFVPVESPVTVVDAAKGFEITIPKLALDHDPMPTRAVSAARLKKPAFPHTFWSIPAFAGEGTASTSTFTVSDEFPQNKLVVVQTN